MPVSYGASGFGTGRLWLRGGRVVAHDLPAPDAAPTTLSGWQAREPTPGRGGLPVALRLSAWWAGIDDDFRDVELDLDALTPFGRRLAAALRDVPRGEVVTYGELAALAGRPGAARAAGTFCARNTLPIFIPCHRVVAATGIGGYGASGLDYKRRLLALEGVSFGAG